jgi:hypothetical protein
MRRIVKSSQNGGVILSANGWISGVFSQALGQAVTLGVSRKLENTAHNMSRICSI